ncbi:MAG TPA: hypothetical protein VEC08_03880 [Nitrososphaerales archaeon]|nr:hypothetical protein [Nitrososphaerales archaeon]
MPRLEPTRQETKPRTSELDQLRKTSTELKKQFLRLTKLVAERLEGPI